MATSLVHDTAATGNVNCCSDLRSAMVALCREAGQAEACALLGGRVDACGMHLVACQPAVNQEHAPDRFAIDPMAFARAEAGFRADGLSLIGFLHSHPGGPPRPSHGDRQQLWPGYLQVIAGGGPRHWRLRAFVANGDGLRPVRWRYWPR